VSQIFPKREIRLIFQTSSTEVVIENLYLQFEFTKALRSKPNDGWIKVWNLKPSTAKLLKDASSLQIVAGYRGNTGLVYRGDIRRASNKARKGHSQGESLATREGLGFVTEITLGGHLEALTQAYVQRSWAGTVPLKQVVKDVIPSFGLSAANLSILPDLTVEDFAWSGKTSDLLDALLLNTDFAWNEDDGLIVFNEVGVPVDRVRVEVNFGTGLLSVPVVEKKSIKFKHLLNPAFRVGGKIYMLSVEASEANGLWKIKKLVLRGDNRDGEHTTEVEAVRAD
jgi:hypothetical protein